MGHACSFKLLYYWVYCMRWNVIAKTSKSTPCDEDIFILHFHICCRYFFSTFFTFTTPSFIHIHYTIHHSIRTSLFYLYTSPCFVAVRIDRSRNFFTFDRSRMFVRPNVRLWWKFSAIGRSLFCAVGEIGKVKLSKWQKKHNYYY